MPIQTPITISKVIENIQSNDYILPAIQREFVWSSYQIERLFDSLMKGYPIGSFLFWKINPANLRSFQFYKFMDHYHQINYRHNEKITVIGDNSKIAILDGQQRLTALYIGLIGWYADKIPYYRWNDEKAYPHRKLYLNLRDNNNEEEMEMNYSFQMLKDNDSQKRDDNNFWFPVGMILNFKELQDVWNYCIDEGLVEKDLKKPSNLLVTLWQVIHGDPVISYFLEEDNDLDKVLNIFIRVNSGGTELSYSDMLLSIATAQWKDIDAREAIYDLVDDLNNTGMSFNFNKDFILKSSLVLSDIRTIEFKVNNFNNSNMMTIQSNWNNLANSLKIATNMISSWGYNRDNLISTNAIIPLAYYITKKNNPENFLNSNKYTEDIVFMKRWLARALLKQTFSGQSDDVLRKVRQVISEHNVSFPENLIYEQLKETTKAMSFNEDQIDGLLDHKYNQPIIFTILSLLYPWLDYSQTFHIDHIHPRANFNVQNLRKLGIKDDEIHYWINHKDDLGNLQLLPGSVNSRKLNTPFCIWLSDEFKDADKLYHYREQHFIPEVNLDFQNYLDFLDKRTEIIKEKLTKIILK